MTDFVETPADCKTASVTSGELSEAELSTAALPQKLRSIRFP
jgi:hypothetical protein